MANRIFEAAFGVQKPNNELFNLYKPPIPDEGDNQPHIPVYTPGFVQQADLLFLPTDNGYKYMLVVVDGSRKLDAEPLKSKSSAAVMQAFKNIYERGLLKFPQTLQVDPGTEFKADVKQYFNSNGANIRYGKPGRHRQQALAERANQTIGRVIHLRQSGQELLTGQPSTEWVDDLPKIIKAMNEISKKTGVKMTLEEPVCEGDSCILLKEGTKVRVILDEPQSVTGEKLHGKFRSSDIRWNPIVQTIMEVIVKPDSPPLYLVNKVVNRVPTDKTDYGVAYTKNQLQVVDKNELAPDNTLIRATSPTYIVESILDKKKIRGAIHYLVKWKGFPVSDATWEKRITLIQDIPTIIADYERNQ